MSTHTAGPWRFDPQAQIVWSDARKPALWICEVRNRPADAALIAAAPELLAACVAVHAQLKTGRWDDGDREEELYKLLAEAIFRARGEL